MAAQRHPRDVMGFPKAIAGRRADTSRGVAGILGSFGGIYGLSGLPWKPSQALKTFRKSPKGVEAPETHGCTGRDACPTFRIPPPKYVTQNCAGMLLRDVLGML